MTVLSPLTSLPKPLQSEISLLRNIVNQTLSNYSAETPLSDKLVVANIIHFSVAAYNRLVSALYFPAHPPITHLYDWAVILEKMDGTGATALILPDCVPEQIVPPEKTSGMTNSDETEQLEAIF
jgi:hypothetical protein